MSTTGACTDIRIPRARHPLSDEEFLKLMSEARQEARRRRIGDPPRGESALSLCTQHAEFGASAH
ncbi:hypothetical protein ABZW47_27845 [Streptomyces sp. NPDC004549]|uniref:hypothetical protein n=1 Tax=Streptomyces sp. NPDC004549 TaxID=3154283 RepID=UPI0033A6D199